MENTNCYIFAFATFGHPNDFRQTPFICNNPDIGKGVNVFDLSNAIKIFPASTVYSIRKQSVSGSRLISYSIYTFAQEKASKRDGTFIGSSITFENKIADEQFVISCLNEFHQKLTENNLSNGILKVNHSKDFIPVPNLSDFDKIKNPQVEIVDIDYNLNNKSLVVYCDISPNNLALLFNNSIDLLNDYDAIYFTNSDEVAKFVAHKGIFKLIQNVGDIKEFDQEIKTLLVERKRKIEKSISDFENEIARLEEDKNKTLNEFQDQINRIQQLHQENDKKIGESKNDLEQVKIIYTDFSNKIKDYSNQLNSGRKLNDVKKLYNENNRIFIDSLQQLKRPNFINKITKARANPGHRDEAKSSAIKSNDAAINEELTKREPQYKIDIFKVATLLLLILWMGTLGYFLFFNVDNEQEVIDNEITQESPTTSKISASAPTPTSVELNPIPQSELNEIDYINVAKKLKYNTEISEVVKLIFDKNPTDIKSVYSGQAELYGKRLIDKNKECFEERSGTYYFIKDTLKHIPSK